MYRRQPLILLVITFFPLIFSLPTQHASAQSTVDCHCFKDRTYDPEQRFLSDEYILATSFNSLLSKAFAIPKRQIVMYKMKGGVGGNDLLIGLKIAEITGVDLEQLLSLRRKKAWQAILSEPHLAESIGSDTLLLSIQAGVPTDEVGQEIADALISDFYAVATENVKSIRKSGLNAKEMALLFIMSHTSELKPQNLAVQYTKEGKSWSEIANNLGITPEAAGKLIINYQK